MGPKEAAIDGAGGGRQDLDEYEPKSDGECGECGIWLLFMRQERENSYKMSAKFIFETLALVRKFTQPASLLHITIKIKTQFLSAISSQALGDIDPKPSRGGRLRSNLGCEGCGMSPN